MQKQDSIDDNEEKKGDHKYYAKEKEMEKQFDDKINQLAKVYKIETIPWLRVTEVVVWIFLLLTCI